MLSKKSLTAQMIVRNEENFVWYAIMSILPFVDKFIIFDNGSLDRTKDIIQTIKSEKIVFEEREGSVEKLRQEQLDRTDTDWFLLIDGDEIYPSETIKALDDLIRNIDQGERGIVLRTRNCVNDIYHFLPEQTGKFHLLGQTGYLTIRAFRKDSKYCWIGKYPLEAYVDENQMPINNQDTKLELLDKYYWHLTHLKRSSLKETITPKRQGKYREEIGVKINNLKPPEVFFIDRPNIVPSPPLSSNIFSLIKGTIITPLKILKRKFNG